MNSDNSAFRDKIRESVTPGNSPLGSEEERALADIVIVVRKRKWWIITSIVLGILVSMLVSTLTVRTYEAVARIEIARDNPAGMSMSELGAMNPMSDEGDTLLETSAAILASDSIAAQVIDHLNLTTDPHFLGWPGPSQEIDSLPPKKRQAALGEFSNGLKVKIVPKTELLEVHFVSRDPELSARIANQAVLEFVKRNVHSKFDSTMEASEWLSKQMTGLKQQVDNSQEQLVALQRSAEIFGLDESHNVELEKLDQIIAAYSAAKSDRIMKEAIYNQAKGGNLEVLNALTGPALGGAQNSQGATNGAGGSPPSGYLDSLRLQKAQLETQYAEALAKYGEAYPRVQQLQRQIESQNASIAAELKNSSKRIQNDYVTALNAENMLAKQLDEAKGKANVLNDTAIKYMIAKREFESGRDLYEEMQKKLKEAGIVAGLNSTNISVVDHASPPAVSNRPRTMLNLAIGLLSGACLGFILAFVVDLMDNTLRNSEEVERVSGLRELGIIPDYASTSKQSYGYGYGYGARSSSKAAAEPTGRRKVWIVDSPQSMVAEAYRSLRSSILLSSPDRAPKVILVTSPLPGEGKSTTSANLAAALAQKSSRVLLVDADLRRPGLNSLFDSQPSAGLSEILTRQASDNHTGSTTECPGLWILRAGPRAPYPAELLASSRMADLINGWREEFDYIVIDSPPLLAVTDATILSMLADSVLLVVRSGKTTRQALHQAARTLFSVNARCAGVLLNAVDVKSADHYYYSGYHYYAAGYEYGSEESK